MQQSTVEAIPVHFGMAGYWHPHFSKKPPAMLTANCFLFWILTQLQPGFCI